MSGTVAILERSQDVLEVASVGLAEDGEEFGVALTKYLINARERAGRFGRELDPVAPAVARVDPPVDEPAGFEVVDRLGNGCAIDPGVVGDFLLRWGAQLLGGEQYGDHPAIEPERGDLGGGLGADRGGNAVDSRREEALFGGFDHGVVWYCFSRECQ